MELFERAEYLSLLHTKFATISAGEGHCVFVHGEAGIGKTSLVKAFCTEVRDGCKILRGACDALFTPRPLAPLYDIMWQLNNNPLPNSHSIEERSGLFANFFRELSQVKEKTIIIFEDIHWADEATLDFIKFFARRINQLRCLFILTYRDNEIDGRHPLRNVLGQLIAGSFTKINLPPLSKQTVEKLADEKGCNGKDIYRISGGNPFYVNELLADYNVEIPDSIRDSILFAYNRCDERSKTVWDVLAVTPGAFELAYIEKVAPDYADEVALCLDYKILIIENNCISFKHEIFRKTIESLITPINKIKIHKKILEMFLRHFEEKSEIERIVHHAKNANDYELVVRYAPMAAARAAAVGAHAQATMLYLSAIECYHGDDIDVLIRFYESYAYECYLTYRIKEAVRYTEKSLNLWKKKGDAGKIGNCLRFLSRLWWFDGNREKAESFGVQAIEVFERQPVSKEKAMAYSNISQLKMLSEQPAECILSGEQAIAMAEELADDEILSHALNNVGNVKIKMPASRQKGRELLEQSLDIALKNSYHEHAARAFTNLSYSALVIKDYAMARKYTDAGIRYCEERDMDPWNMYMLSSSARLELETCNWEQALRIAENILENEGQSPIIKITSLVVVATIQLRRGDTGMLPLLYEAKEKAFETMELSRIIPALTALLEYEWITGTPCIEKNELEQVLSLMERMGNIYENSQFVFWLSKARKQTVALREIYEGYDISSTANIATAVALWEKSGNLYEQALLLFEGDEVQKRKAVAIAHELGAIATCERMKMEMRASGIKSIPRGMRKSTRSNTALLTEREIDVLQLLKENLQNKEIASRLFISAKTVDNHISSILLKLDVNSRIKAVSEALRLEIIK